MPQVIKQHPDKPDHFLIERAVLQYEEVKKDRPELSTISETLPIAVLGAGPSLPEDIKRLPKGCLLMSCNHHAFRLVNPDYMVFLDPPDNNHSNEYKELVRNPKCTRISQLIDFTDIYTVNEFPKVLNPIGDTGMFGTWVACQLTSGKVYLCGMGLRKDGEPQHFYDSGMNQFWGGTYYDNKLKKWERVLSYCDQTRIIPISGPLSNFHELLRNHTS